MNLYGASAATTSTDGTGKYNFTGLANGLYVVAPSRSGYEFTPATASVNITNASVSAVSFTAHAIPPKVILSWTASTSANVTSYNVYRRSTLSGPYTKVTKSPVAALKYVDSAVSAGQVYFYVATAVDSAGNESTYSTETSATVPIS